MLGQLHFEPLMQGIKPGHGIEEGVEVTEENVRKFLVLVEAQERIRMFRISPSIATTLTGGARAQRKASISSSCAEKNSS